MRAFLNLVTAPLILLACLAPLCAWVYQERNRLKAWAVRIDTFLGTEDHPDGSALWPLFVVSFATLYVEIMLIRWIGTEVRVFAFFQNLALIACFLGFGLGCYWSQGRKSLALSLAAIAALVVLVQAPARWWKYFLTMLSGLLTLSPDADLWGFSFSESAGRGTLLMLMVLAVIAVALFLLLMVATMVPLGQWVGYYLDAASNPITAYSVNLLGSVAGVWAFAAMAFLWLPPVYWFGVAFILLLLARPPHLRFGVATLVILGSSSALLLHKQGNALETHWSPYQEVEVSSLGHSEYSVSVNHSGYMTISHMSPEYLTRTSQIAEYNRGESSYDAPFRFANQRDAVLIVGAGAGNDAAAALRNGAQHVDTVEIDPVMYFLGRKLHPDRPYQSPRVHEVLDDARAFMRHAQQKYDIVLFGLLDSHTQFSDYTNMRVDNYVYTEEAFRDARRLLKPGGILAVKFEVRAPWTWMGQRFYAMLGRIFGRPPIVFYAGALGNMTGATVFVASDDSGLWTRAREPELAQIVAQNPPPFPLTTDGAPPPATDDWPYVYHRSHSVPRTYLTVSLILLALAFGLAGGVLEPTRASTWQFFFLGAGFLLLETQLVSRLALYFGTTWLVNCIALTAILLVLVAANVYVSRRRLARLGPFYLLLIAFLLAAYFFPWQDLPYGARTVGVLLSAAYSIPVFFAGVIFTELFRRFGQRSSAFGANIVGAVAGGLAQNASFIVGMKALLLIAAFSYASAGLSGLFRPSLE